MKRKIITIDEEKCNGCGLCIPNCPEEAIQLIDGKARLVSDLFCDGLGACIGHCPEEAISIEEREATPYDEKKVMENIIKHGENTIKAHLLHLKEHDAHEYLRVALDFLKVRGITVKIDDEHEVHHHEGACPGSKTIDFTQSDELHLNEGSSQLGHWPIQLHLMSPLAPHYHGKDVIIVADCVAYAVGDFHERFLKGKALAIACPKLDNGRDIYIEKLQALIDQTNINTITVITMEVPCCSGLLILAKEALERAKRYVPIKHVEVSLKGEVLREEWISQGIKEKIH